MLAPSIFVEVAEKFGTPTYVYDEDKIIGQLSNLRQAMIYRPSSILYAMKANSNPNILDTIRAYGLGIDAVSPGEIALALKVGFDPSDILFTANNIVDEEVEFAINKGVLLNVDSLSRLKKMARDYPRIDVCVRINPDVGAGHHDHCITGGPESKFGVWHTEVDKVLEVAEGGDLRIVGLHQHIGSGILDPDIFMLAMEAILGLIPEFPDLAFVDFGGGLGIPYRPSEDALSVETLGQKISSRFTEFCGQSKRKLELVIEPGRYLVAEAGYLLVRVNTIKRNPDGRVFVGVNSGFNHLIRPAMYGSYHEIVNISNLDGSREIADVVGNICESGDKFAEQRRIFECREGDLLAITNAGAYGYSMSSNYNLRPRPAEAMIMREGNVKLVRRRETIEDLI